MKNILPTLVFLLAVFSQKVLPHEEENKIFRDAYKPAIAENDLETAQQLLKRFLGLTVDKERFLYFGEHKDIPGYIVLSYSLKPSLGDRGFCRTTSYIVGVYLKEGEETASIIGLQNFMATNVDNRCEKVGKWTKIEPDLVSGSHFKLAVDLVRRFENRILEAFNAGFERKEPIDSFEIESIVWGTRPCEITYFCATFKLIARDYSLSVKISGYRRDKMSIEHMEREFSFMQDSDITDPR